MTRVNISRCLSATFFTVEEHSQLRTKLRLFIQYFCDDPLVKTAQSTSLVTQDISKERRYAVDSIPDDIPLRSFASRFLFPAVLGRSFRFNLSARLA